MLYLGYLAAAVTSVCPLWTAYSPHATRAEIWPERKHRHKAPSDFLYHLFCKLSVGLQSNNCHA